MGNLVRLYSWVVSKNVGRIERGIHQEIEKERKGEGSIWATVRWVEKPAAGVEVDNNPDEAARSISFTRPSNGLKTMNDVIWLVRNNLGRDQTDMPEELVSRFLTIESTSKSSVPFQENGCRNPSFVLLVLVQERFAYIIANEIAGCHSHVQINNDTAALTVDTLSRTAKKWYIPRRARKAFLTVTFETILYVGDYQLVSQGADSILTLSPFEFHELMSPLLAAFGDAGTMEGWMARTEHLARSTLAS